MNVALQEHKLGKVREKLEDFAVKVVFTASYTVLSECCTKNFAWFAFCYFKRWYQWNRPFTSAVRENSICK